jgi:predicted nucleotidyltransferase
VLGRARELRDVGGEEGVFLGERIGLVVQGDRLRRGGEAGSGSQRDHVLHIRAAHSCRVELLPASAAPPAGPIGRRLRRRRAAVLALAARHGISNVRVFGSVARGQEGPTSDLDLLVHLPEGAVLFALGRFRQDLEALLRVAVDVVPDDGVKPRVRANIAKDLVSL